MEAVKHLLDRVNSLSKICAHSDRLGPARGAGTARRELATISTAAPGLWRNVVRAVGLLWVGLLGACSQLVYAQGTIDPHTGFLTLVTTVLVVPAGPVTRYFYHADLLGSIANLTDERGQVVAAYEYEAFGTIKGGQGAPPEPFAVTGREYDPALGLYFYRARYYDPALGRFLTRDLLPATIVAPLSFNPSLYVRNNPPSFTDPLGLDAEYVNNVLRQAGWGPVRYEPNWIAWFRQNGLAPAVTEVTGRTGLSRVVLSCPAENLANRASSNTNWGRVQPMGTLWEGEGDTLKFQPRGRFLNLLGGEKTPPPSGQAGLKGPPAQPGGPNDPEFGALTRSGLVFADLLGGLVSAAVCDASGSNRAPCLESGALGTGYSVGGAVALEVLRRTAVAAGTALGGTALGALGGTAIVCGGAIYGAFQGGKQIKAAVGEGRALRQSTARRLCKPQAISMTRAKMSSLVRRKTS